MPSVGSKVRERMSLPPRRYQIQAARFLEDNGGRGILGDDMGLGKTYEVIAWLSIHPEIRRVVVVCPAAVKYQWQDMLRNLADLPSCVLSGRTPYRPTKRICVANYDILATAKWPGGKRRKGAKPRFPWVEMLRSHPIDLVILDECQYVKDVQSLRTRAAIQLCKRIPRVIGSSGTPIEKAPVEFYPILHMVAPREFSSFWSYVMRYCDPKRAFRGRGWDFSGTNHLKELHRRTKPWIIRRMKVDVAKELPAKIRTVLPVPLSNRDAYDEAQTRFLYWLKKTKGRKAADRAAEAVGLTKLGVLKRIAGLGKIRALTRWIKDYLENHNDKLVVFAVHLDVIDQLRKAFPTAAVITGGIQANERPGIVYRFQKDPKCRVFLGQIKAAGTGVDGLHKVCSTALFAELRWNWSEHEQAEDRILRIGQEATNVNIFYMVGRNTVEEPILDLIQSKADITNRVLHGSVLGPLFNRRGNVGLHIQ